MQYTVIAITISEKNAKNFLHTFTMGNMAQKSLGIELRLPRVFDGAKLESEHRFPWFCSHSCVLWALKN